MKVIRVPLKENSYNIVVGCHILPSLGSQIQRLKIGDDAIVVTNAFIRKLYGNTLSQSLKKKGIAVTFLEVADTEQSKSAKVALHLIEEIARMDIKKKLFIIAFGGGVIGDLAGFVAAVYKRGIPYVQVPTTFLAQIDSAIGGKVAIDLQMGKNLVGAFYQPKMVFTDVALLKTLSLRQIRNGLAEAVKYGMIKDKNLFVLIENHVASLLSADIEQLAAVVLKCSHIKAQIVAQDEKEIKGLRTILNFGHTVGHAVEAAGGYQGYQHGEAISLGMRVAGVLACDQKMFCPSDLQRLEKLLDAVGLPAKIKNVKFSALRQALTHDKKIIAKKNRFVLPQRIGSVKVVEGIPEQGIAQAIKKYLI